MATSKELLKAQDNGSEIRVNYKSGAAGALVEYRPRYKGDRQPWASLEGSYVFRYTSSKCVAVTPEVAPVSWSDPVPEVIEVVNEVVNETQEEVSMNITPEVIKALAALRDVAYGDPLMDAINVLDNAGIFDVIDEAGGYDVDPEQLRALGFNV